MATSGTSNFDPTFDDILQDAAGMVGGGPILAEELIAAKRGLDYLLTDIQNRNVLLQDRDDGRLSFHVRYHGGPRQYGA